MGSTGNMLLGIIEFIIAMFVIVALVLCFIYRTPTFFEPRMSSLLTGMKLVALFNCVVSLLFPFAKRSALTTIVIFLTGCSWLNLFARNFPFVSFLSVHFILPFAMSAFSHAAMTFDMISNQWKCGAFLTLAYFFIFVWGIPVLVGVTVFSLDDSKEYSTSKKADLALKKTFTKFFDWIKRLFLIGAKKIK